MSCPCNLSTDGGMFYNKNEKGFNAQYCVLCQCRRHGDPDGYWTQHSLRRTSQRVSLHDAIVSRSLKTVDHHIEHGADSDEREVEDSENNIRRGKKRNSTIQLQQAIFL